MQVLLLPLLLFIGSLVTGPSHLMAAARANLPSRETEAFHWQDNLDSGTSSRAPSQHHRHHRRHLAGLQLSGGGPWSERRVSHHLEVAVNEDTKLVRVKRKGARFSTTGKKGPRDRLDYRKGATSPLLHSSITLAASGIIICALFSPLLLLA